MAGCAQCQGIEEVFSREYVEKELDRYREKGPRKTTRLLSEALRRQGVQGQTLLDIGGGVGAIAHALLEAGLAHATAVDASSAYIDAARAEAQRRGQAGRVDFRRGDFVELAAEIPPADIVTLDRVICCYPEMERLVRLSSGRARRIYALVYPRDTWWTRLAITLQNFYLKLRRSPFRSYIHPAQAVEALVRESGFEQTFYRSTLVWQVVVYAQGNGAQAPEGAGR